MRRLDNAGNIPTVSEAGVPGYAAETWFGIVAPIGTPDAIVNRLSSELAKVMNSTEVRGGLEAQGVIIVASTPAEFGRRIQSDVTHWRKIITTAKISLD